MAAPVEQKVNATYFKSSSTQPCCCQQNEGNFHLYMHQIAAGPDVNQKVAVNPDNPTTAFGEFVVNDWSITEGPDPASKLVAREQGMHVGVGHIKLRWYFSCNIVFEDESLTGSTLEVRGAWGTSFPMKLAVVGGTGQFTNAQGIVSVTNVSSSSTRAVHELFIRIFYTTIDI